jgi:hypothetical protein
MTKNMILQLLHDHPAIHHSEEKLVSERFKMMNSEAFKENNPDGANYTDLEILIILQAWLYWQKMWNKGIGDFA